MTAELKRFGLPLTLDWESIGKQLLALSPEDQAAIKSAGLAEYMEGGAGQDVEPEALGKWSIVTRYHWTQTFPAGAEVRVSHAYTNRPPGGLFMWTHPPEYERELIGQYCIDEGTSKGMAKALKATGGDESQQYSISYRIDYVLRTANSWAGPIRAFTLTLDKGDPRNIISLCIDGVKKTGPTTFVVEKKNFIPDRDLQILIVDPSGNL
ncbi:MAG: DUF4424 family protein [Ahniella sp.]|nr:DUF4424 family protein [Ahniella sp.]